MTLIRFKPETTETAPTLPTGDLLRDFMSLHFPFLPKEKAGLNDWSPALDVHDGKEALTVTLEAPGLKKEDFEISYHDGVLSVAGERKQEKETNEKNYFRRERLFGRFTRSVSLPTKVKAEGIVATYHDGVLKVTLPKEEVAKPKQIEVNIN
ncbi:MAG: Hsp20/alpha crystallin family protein [Chthoniobacterales bacterium]|jgi:HSP20 family protein